MSLFETHNENSLYLSMHDVTESLSRFADTPFLLEDRLWPTVEHYYQALKFIDIETQQTILELTSPEQAIKFAKQWRNKFKVRKDWNNIKTTVMTRAIYTKCRTHPNIAEKLIATANEKIVENSQFDYFWGCGRDKRGNNHYGKILMNVREKLTAENIDKQ